jgi:hypothetical protein
MCVNAPVGSVRPRSATLICVSRTTPGTMYVALHLHGTHAQDEFGVYPRYSDSRSKAHVASGKLPLVVVACGKAHTSGPGRVVR